MQRILADEQLKAFYHDEFVEDQVRDFWALIGGRQCGVVADLGGGCGYFAQGLRASGHCEARVIDLDPASVEACRRAGVPARIGDALDPPLQGDEELASFNLILHHLVGGSERITRDLQRTALSRLQGRVSGIFVNEYIYESYAGRVSGWLIFQITKSKVLSAIGRAISSVVPSLKANTFGVGVRFRSHDEWREIFEEAGYCVKSCVKGRGEPVSLARRLLLIKQIRRDSFLLVPRELHG
jgi:hypothetical protein